MYSFIVLKCVPFFPGHEHLKLIFDFSVWVLKAHPDDGLKVTSKDFNENMFFSSRHERGAKKNSESTLGNFLIFNLVYLWKSLPELS